MKWVKLKKYCELSGDTTDAVHSKRRSGLWREGVEWKKAADQKIWINLEKVDEWVENCRVA